MTELNYLIKFSHLRRTQRPEMVAICSKATEDPPLTHSQSKPSTGRSSRSFFTCLETPAQSSGRLTTTTVQVPSPAGRNLQVLHLTSHFIILITVLTDLPVSGDLG